MTDENATANALAEVKHGNEALAALLCGFFIL